jgi:predicted PurR-regulated permease PerM
VGAILYFVACAIVAFFGRHRVQRWWGTLILSVVLTPVLVAIVLLLTAPRLPHVVRRTERIETASG